MASEDCVQHVLCSALELELMAQLNTWSWLNTLSWGTVGGQVLKPALLYKYCPAIKYASSQGLKWGKKHKNLLLIAQPLLPLFLFFLLCPHSVFFFPCVHFKVTFLAYTVNATCLPYSSHLPT